jgi:curved DNA-binding protein CbpA
MDPAGLLALDNYYEILDVSPTADARDIRKQYRKRALQVIRR